MLQQPDLNACTEIPRHGPKTRSGSNLGQHHHHVPGPVNRCDEEYVSNTVRAGEKYNKVGPVAVHLDAWRSASMQPHAQALKRGPLNVRGVCGGPAEFIRNG